MHHNKLTVTAYRSSHVGELNAPAVTMSTSHKISNRFRNLSLDKEKNELTRQEDFVFVGYNVEQENVRLVY